MKKQLIAAAVIAGLITAGTASANWGRGGGGGMMGNYGNCPQAQSAMSQTLDQETRDKIRQFYKDNQALQKEIVMKHAEKRALMQGSNPDPKSVARLTGEIFDLRATLQGNAEAAGLEQYVGIGRMGKGSGHKGYGRKGMGQGFGPNNGPVAGLDSLDNPPQQ